MIHFSPLCSRFLIAATMAAVAACPLFAVPFELEGPAVDPDDFRVTVFASGLDFPVGMAELPDGSILATVSEGSAYFDTTGKLIRLVDDDDDGVADMPPQVLYDDLPGTQTAVCVGGDLVFVTGQGRPITILRLGKSPSDPLTLVGEILFDYSGSYYHAHSALELRETPGANDSYDLFFQLGSDSNFATSTRTVPVSSSTVSGVGAVLVGDSAYRMTIVDHGSEVSMAGLTRIGSGLRNAAGFTFHPATGDLYLQDNGIDGLENVNEPHSADELNLIAREEIGRNPAPHFGYPDNYTAYRTGEVVGGEGVQPLIAFQPIPAPDGRRSEGPNGITHAPPAFPEGLNRGIFLGFHGKFNMGGLNNDENPVVYADPETGKYFHFIHGQQEGIGHLIGLLATRDSLFIADLVTTGHTSDGAGGGVIYQIKSIAQPVPPSLTAHRDGAQIELLWDRGGLQEAADPAGPWQDIGNAFSPLLVDPTKERRFYRAVY